jgi:hypothetical protein
VVRTATKKAQVILSVEQYELVRAYAEGQGKPVSLVLREFLERTILADLKQQRAEAAYQRLIHQELPVADWEEIERDLEGRWVGHE